MTETNKLAELIKNAKSKMWGKTFHSELERNMFVADYLLANGVIVPPCELYEEVYCIVFSPKHNKLIIQKGFTVEMTIKYSYLNIKIVDCVPIKYASLNITVNAAEIGNTVFLTKEEAEEKLKELQNE